MNKKIVLFIARYLINLARIKVHSHFGTCTYQLQIFVQLIFVLLLCIFIVSMRLVPILLSKKNGFNNKIEENFCKKTGNSPIFYLFGLVDKIPA